MSLPTNRTDGGRPNTLTLSVGQWEREAIGERTRETLQHLRCAGVPMGAPGLGWCYGEGVDDEGRHLVEPVEDELRTVERIRELRRAGMSMRDIATTLTREGLRTKKGARWHAATVLRVLRRES